MRCRTCRFWEEINQSLGRCHRYAPRPRVKEGTGNRMSLIPLWPKTKADEWCGDWSVRVKGEPWETG